MDDALGPMTHRLVDVSSGSGLSSSRPLLDERRALKPRRAVSAPGYPHRATRYVPCRCLPMRGEAMERAAGRTAGRDAMCVWEPTAATSAPRPRRTAWGAFSSLPAACRLPTGDPLRRRKPHSARGGRPRAAYRHRLTNVRVSYY